MAMGNLAGIVAKLKEHGLEGDTPVGIVHEGTKPAQEVLTATIDTVIAEVARSGISAPAIVVIGDVVRERERIRWFDAQPLFGKRVLITRPAHQADEFVVNSVAKDKISGYISVPKNPPATTANASGG